MKKNIRKLHESFQHALRGLVLCIGGERNFRVHLVAAFYVTIFALLGHADAGDAMVLSLCFGLTMSAELMNTAIERLSDQQAEGYDSMVRNAKDIAAAGVFVCAVACVAVGFFLFLGKGLLWQAFATLAGQLWLAMVLIVSAPIALWFIFQYGRVQ